MYVPTGDIKSIRKEQSGTAKDVSYKGIARHKRPSDSLEYNCYRRWKKKYPVSLEESEMRER